MDDKLLTYARQLRRDMTDAEQLLWQLLRNRQILQAKFRRQHPIGPYIVDFYCAEVKLAIELDGGQHLERICYDTQRTEYLSHLGIQVLRFWNNQVLNETENVLDIIYQALAHEPSPQPSP